MKAAVYSKYGSPDVLSLIDTTRAVAGADDVVVRVRATTVGAADSAARLGSPYFSRLFFGLFGPKKPILGSDFAGVVEAVGADVTRFSIGDQVFGSTGPDLGTHAEFVTIAQDGGLALMPSNLSFSESVALVGGVLTAMPFLRDVAKIQPGQSILINGASGSVGSAAVQLAKHYGARVTAVCGSANIQLVRSLGADDVIDYSVEDFTRNGTAYDVIFDAVGKSSFSQCRRLLAPGGIYLSTVPAAGLMLQVARTAKSRVARAAIAFTGLRPPSDKAEDLVIIRELAEAGVLTPVIESEFALESIADAYAIVDGGHKKGNVVVTLG